MARRTVDLVAAGPPVPDVQDPAGPAWALASGLAARGHSVHIVFPGEAPKAPPDPAVSFTAISPVTAHLGSALGDAELARAAVRWLRPEADVVVRDPSGLGSLGHRAADRAVISFVRSLESAREDPAASGPKLTILRSKLLGWGGRHGVHHLEHEALSDATAICCATAAQRDRLRTEFDLPAERLRVVASAVPPGPPAPTREAARAALHVPSDADLAVVLPATDPADRRVVAPAVEAIRLTRRLFAGARLAVVGVPELQGPGVVAVPGREPASLAAALAAADVAVAGELAAEFDAAVVAAMRAGLPTLVRPSLDLGPGADGAVRTVVPTEPAALAAALAELFADAEARKALGEAARELAHRHDPDRLVAELEAGGVLGAA